MGIKWNEEMIERRIEYPIILEKKKDCACGRSHRMTPPNTIMCKDKHIWFNCKCGSTLVVLNYRSELLECNNNES
jgi:hypothetical protein